MTESERRSYGLRRATSTDIPQICNSERSATAKFSCIPALADLAGGGPESTLPAEKVQNWLDQGRIYLVEDAERAVGFVAAVPMDASLFIAEVSVLLDENGRGVGTQLLQAVFTWARERASEAADHSRATVSLTTYADVPWNGPWYARRGFKEVAAEEIGPNHVAKMTLDEEEQGLLRPGYRRCCMLCELGLVEPRQDG